MLEQGRLGLALVVIPRGHQFSRLVAGVAVGSGARRHSAGPGGSCWSSGGGRMPMRSGGSGGRAGAGAGGSATT